MPTLEEIEVLREAGDRMADELSVLKLNGVVSRRGREALDDWDPLSLDMRRKLKEQES